MSEFKRRSKKARKEHWPCVICKKNCCSNSVCCDVCKCWVHAKCEGYNPEDLDSIAGKCPFTCRSCVQAEDAGEYSYLNALLRLRKVCY